MVSFSSSGDCIGGRVIVPGRITGVSPGQPTIIYTFDLSVNFVETGILVLFLVLKKFFRSPKSRYDFGILIGFGISAATTIVSDGARLYFGSGYETWFRYGPSIGYAVASLVWLLAFLRRPEHDRPDPQRVRQLFDSMREQNALLDRILNGIGLRHAEPPDVYAKPC